MEHNFNGWRVSTNQKNMSRAHARLFFLGSQSKRTLLGILRAQLSDFYTGNSTRNFGKLNWFTLGELQRGQRAETKTANSKPRERIPSFLAGCACVDPICVDVFVHALHLRAESSTLSVHLIFFLEIIGKPITIIYSQYSQFTVKSF